MSLKKIHIQYIHLWFIFSIITINCTKILLIVLPGSVYYWRRKYVDRASQPPPQETKALLYASFLFLIFLSIYLVFPWFQNSTRIEYHVSFIKIGRLISHIALNTSRLQPLCEYTVLFCMVSLVSFTRIW